MFVHPTTPQSTPGLDSTSSGTPASEPGRPRLSVESGVHGPVTILTMTGQLVSETVVAAEAKILTTLVLTDRPFHLALDLSQVDVIDGSGSGLLAKARFAARSTRSTLHLIAPDGGPARLALHRTMHKITLPSREDLIPALAAESDDGL
ncbi:STAS domain-containing protein [Spirillospora sp. NBC_00431]